MRASFYPKMAWDGIRKNRRLYLPYLITCMVMVMMHYIVSFLSTTSVLASIPGSDSIGFTLELGSWVMAFFSLLFLFYSNAFLMRRRKKEFGLYNILGMGKWNISKILLWETGMTALLSLAVGLAAGVGLSKLFELGMVNLMGGQVSTTFSVSPGDLLQTALIFCVIFLLLLLNSLRQISLSNPIALLRSESAGEKPPRANWLLGILGVLLLAAAYYLAVIIEDPLAALMLFFVAVLLVIAATYLLFIAGSVVLCRLLQKKKGYYYKANHFVSTASMVYRMKRNGAGLASICILLTMVLVMLSSTAALFFGEEDSLNTRYPRGFNVSVYATDTAELNPAQVEQLRDSIGQTLEAYDAQPENLSDYRYASTFGMLKDLGFDPDATALDQDYSPLAPEIAQLFLIPLEDYNRLTGERQTLAQDEVLLRAYRTDYTAATFSIPGGKTYQVKATASESIGSGDAAMAVIPSVYLVVPDFEQAVASLQTQAEFTGEQSGQVCWYYGFDLNLPAETQIEIYRELRDSDLLQEIETRQLSCTIESREANRGDFYGTFGGLFFLGIMLSIVFLTAAVLMIYYKQITEGYEDQSRFEIMQKVGMTRREIRRSINSQILTVFFAPLMMAGLHMCFAFPMIQKLLTLFNLWNTGLLAATTAVCFVIFGLFYALVYRITSNAYFAIVSGVKDD